MKTYPVKVFRNIFLQWRWKVKASNGKIVAASTESFKNRLDCEHNIDLTAASLAEHIKNRE